MCSSDPDPGHVGFWSQPFSVQWRKAMVSLPRAVPLIVLHYTSPEGPQPFVHSMQSRGKYLIPIYVFVPEKLEPKDIEAGLPVVIDFHGGGFVLGSCLEQAPFCAKLARDLGAVVLSVDYRMGPIDKFPAAIEDGEDVLSAVLDPTARGYRELREAIAKRIVDDHKHEWKKNGQRKALDRLKHNTPPDALLDPNYIALSGFSSGGNLALNLALSVSAAAPNIEEAWPSRFPDSYGTRIPLLLYYPSFDCRKLPSERTNPPGLQPSKGFWSAANDLLMPTYLPRDKADHPRASPGLAVIRDGGLHEQARIQLVLPELDSLSEQSEAWVKKMEEEGRNGDLQVDRYQGMKHGWTQFPETWMGEKERIARMDAFEKTLGFVRNAWDRASDEDGKSAG